ncbi:MAG: SLC13 family permease [Rhodospirillales bacterium]|nr:SLC13 family permease [Rhodospirillales bacterium]
MTLPQIESLAIIAGMLVLFLSDRLRYDLVGATALSVAALLGVVPAHKAFSGFSSPVIIIIASVLVISRAVAVSGLIELWMRRLLRRLDSTTLQVGALTAAVTFLSAFVKNVGALGVFMPVAIQAAEQRNRPVSRYLMPLAFGSLIGGTITQIGTSPNILISEVRQQVTGHPYGLFDYTSIGLPLSIVAIVFLALGWRLLPANRRGQRSAEKRFSIEDYTSEALLPPDSPLVGKTVGELEALGEGTMSVAAIIREESHRYVPRSHWTLFADDVLVLQGDPTALQPVIDQAGLRLLNAEQLEQLRPHGKEDELEATEAVVGPNSLLIGRTPKGLHLRQTYEVNVLAVRTGRRAAQRLSERRFEPGDIIVLQGRTTALADALEKLSLLPLAERNLAIGRPRTRALPLLILLAALLAIGMRWVDVEVGFFVAATVILLLRLITVREAYEAIDWPVIVMLGCLIPVGESLKDTGTAKLLADGLTLIAAQLPGMLAVGLILVVSMLVTPFLHHAAAVLVMGPVAAVVAKNLGFGPDPFLMAVAFGAACDFLTPIGHQNSTLVMRPAGYRFGDYWRLGLPLSVLVAIAGTWLIVWSWPLK